MTNSKWTVALGVAALGGIGLSAPASAADNAMQVCGAKYQAAKKANQLPAGQTWNQFLAQCRAGLKGATPTPAAKPVAATVREYSPTGRLEKWNVPSRDERTVLVSPVFTLRAATSAPDTAAVEGSAIWPSSVPVGS